MRPLAFATRLTLIAMITMAGGCQLTDRDVSHDPRFLVGYQPGQVYRLVQSVSAVELSDNHLELIPLGMTLKYGKPAGTLPAGTRFRIRSLRYLVAIAPFNGESCVRTDAQLVDPPNAYVYLIKISGVRWVDADHERKAAVDLPDPKWVELVDAGTDDPSKRQTNGTALK